MDFQNIKNITIPEGEVVSISVGDVMLWQKARLPSEYQEVAYLESTGTQYIDTGITPSEDFKVVARMAFTTNPAGTSAEQLNGVSYGGRCAWGYTKSVATQNFYIGIKEKNIDTGVTLDALPHTFVINMDGSWCIDDYSGQLDCGTSMTASNVWLFARNRASGAVNAACKEKCYFCQIYQDGVLVRNMIPCYRTSDSKPGMFDLVSKTFLTNSGTGEFTYAT